MEAPGDKFSFACYIQSGACIYSSRGGSRGLYQAFTTYTPVPDDDDGVSSFLTGTRVSSTAFVD